MARKKEYISQEIPDLGEVEKKDMAKHWYQLGRASAGMDFKLQKIQQDTMLSLAQQVKLMNMMTEAERMLSQLDTKQQQAVAASVPPPMMGGGPMGAPPGGGLPMGGPPPPPGGGGLPVEGLPAPPGAM